MHVIINILIYFKYIFNISHLRLKGVDKVFTFGEYGIVF